MGIACTVQVVYVDEAVTFFIFVTENIQKKTAFPHVVRFWPIQEKSSITYFKGYPFLRSANQ